MSISRREFFVRLLAGTADEVPKIIPKKIQPFLGIEPEAISAEQAGLEMTKLKRNRCGVIQSPEISSPSAAQPALTDPLINCIHEPKPCQSPL